MNEENPYQADTHELPLDQLRLLGDLLSCLDAAGYDPMDTQQLQLILAAHLRSQAGRALPGPEDGGQALRPEPDEALFDRLDTAALIARSSLGTPSARRIRSLTSAAQIAEILRRRDQVATAGHGDLAEPRARADAGDASAGGLRITQANNQPDGDSPTHSQEDHTQIRPLSGNPLPDRCSSSGDPGQGDSAYGRAGSRSELPILPDCPQPGPKVSVVIPTLNEARNLPFVFSKFPPALHEVIIVDGHSVDDTVATARQLRPDVRIIMQSRRGKGNALACGFAAATGDIIAMVDADGSADPAEIPQFVKALLDGADFAKGTRFAKGGGSSDITRLRRLGNRMLTGMVNTLCRAKYSDLCYGYSAFWRRHVPVFGLDAESPVPADGTRLRGDGFEVQALINIRIAQAGLAVTEVASYEHSRIHGVSNLNAASDGWRVLRTILAERYYYHPRPQAQPQSAGTPAHRQDTVIPESASRTG